jgi:very-short-patch-repair endonuclease
MGVRFRRQQPIGPFIVDYYCASARLVVEIDGGGHALERKSERDRERDRTLEREGIRVLRFWNTDVLQNLEGVLESILTAIGRPSPLPSPGGRGG